MQQVITSGELVLRLLSALADSRVSRKGRPLWSVVGKLFCVGSTTASEICTAYGYDPDMLVRGPK